MKKITILCLLSWFSLAVQAATETTVKAPLPEPKSEYNYGFATLSLNFLNWSEQTEKRSQVSGTKEDFYYVEIEGGAGYDWGSLYGFIDFENPGKSPGDSKSGVRTAAKGNVTYKIFETPVSLYAHIYQFTTDDIQEQSRVFGLAYDVNISKLWFQPFLGVHDVVTVVDTPQAAADQGIQYDGYSGYNGLMTGWLLRYDFHKHFYTFWWHESEILRPDKNGVNSIHQKNSGHNGALSFWYQRYLPIVLGLQYRYADHKLGTPSYQDGVIMTLKHNL